MSINVNQLHLRLFLEGIEVPVIAADISMQPNQPAQASIQMISTDSALLFLPRTLVHLFFLDEKLNASEIDSGGGEQLEDGRYKLLFSGEIVGFYYTKNSNSRSFVIQCLDFSSYWDACFQWFADYSVNGNFADRSHHFVGSNQSIFNNITTGVQWGIGNILNSKPENPRYADLPRGLLAGYIHLLESIGGVRPRNKSYAGFRGANDFFSIAELRYGLTSMLGAVPNDKTAARLYRIKAFQNWLRNGMASAGSLVSFRDVLRLAGQYIYHDVYPNPSAFYKPAGADLSTVIVPRSATESTLGKQASKLLKQASNSLSGLVSKLNTLTKNEVNSILKSLSGVIQNIIQAKDFISSANANDSQALSVQLEQALSNLRIVQIRLNTTVVGKKIGESVSGNVKKAANIVDLIISNSTTVRKTKATVKVPDADFLFNQLILPETFFLSPPKCNVIFPDMYISLKFSRSFTREVSRFALQSGFGAIQDQSLIKLIGRYYFAPNIKDVKNKIARRSVFSSAGTLMPHEVHSGIIPKLEWVTEGHRWGVKSAKEIKETKRNVRISYIQRLANFQFFLHRWSSRSMNLTGRFMPQLVLGLPSVVLDRGIPSPSALQAMAETVGSGVSIFPTAFLGKINNLQHSVSQSGGSTTVAFKFARTHRGLDDEFLGVVQREQTNQTVDIIDVAFDTVEQRLLSGTSVSSLESRLMQMFFSGELQEQNNLAISKKIVKLEKIESDVTTSITRQTASLLGISNSVFDLYIQRNGAENSSSGEIEAVVPNAILVSIQNDLSGGQFKTAAGAAPAEVLIKPGWYDVVWNSVKLGGDGSPEAYPISDNVYRPLLGTFAITDDKILVSEFSDLLQTFVKQAGDASVIIEKQADGTEVVKLGDVVIASFNVKDHSIERSIDALTVLYGMLKLRGTSVSNFIADYTRRPIASLTDILGDSDLLFDESGNPFARADGTIPRVGFHSKAYGDFNSDVQYTSSDPQAGKNAMKLLLPSDSDVLDRYSKTVFDKSTKTKTPQIPSYLDPRGRAHQRVKVYATELTLTRGLLGV